MTENKNENKNEKSATKILNETWGKVPGLQANFSNIKERNYEITSMRWFQGPKGQENKLSLKMYDKLPKGSEDDISWRPVAIFDLKELFKGWNAADEAERFIMVYGVKQKLTDSVALKQDEKNLTNLEEIKLIRICSFWKLFAQERKTSFPKKVAGSRISKAEVEKNALRKAWQNLPAASKELLKETPDFRCFAVEDEASLREQKPQEEQKLQETEA